mmetsp:Transcript_10456/g.12871  ORF Transcript_10456/g.12871 Transcript_10456/m.12871 type:complete len:169 (-) Transcript_10456:120-626(-)|eukprot:CAMPEP_0172500230 /NCGR_PEP_ID=MMETSP1066-20121228/136018_1 /TAXON_ID=671091 /ORGANISM="Coscinodiscus wailesii, Strain CCMP2513" /LENGTH=168 /DNA_ID=CAMNT_0013274359 /DNA_START=209 /DNA_END=715 /DNA_ORIENTATION=-
MTLTEEQKERIRRNRERAIEIRKQKLAERNDAHTPPHPATTTTATTTISKTDAPHTHTAAADDDDSIPLEDFEKGAPPTVTKKDATKIYCLPEGTLAVCRHVEKDNPRRKGWSAMKLYDRAEIRRRARERYGGLDGLIAERKKREERRFMKDMEVAKGIFGGGKEGVK